MTSKTPDNSPGCQGYAIGALFGGCAFGTIGVITSLFFTGNPEVQTIMVGGSVLTGLIVGLLGTALIDNKNSL